MPSSLSTIEERLVSMIRADKSSPSTTDIGNLHQDNIILWCNELKSIVVEQLAIKRDDSGEVFVDPINFEALMVVDSSLTFSSGSVNIPSDSHIVLSVKAGSSDRLSNLLRDPADFSLLDSYNFLTTPTSDYPVVLVAEGKIRVLPGSITSGKVSYLKIHPTISTSQGTVWTEAADKVLLELLFNKYFEYKGRRDKSQDHLQIAASIN